MHVPPLSARPLWVGFATAVTTARILSTVAAPANTRRPTRAISSSTAVRMRQNRLPAAYYRGGTSRAIMFKAQDLPPDRDSWAAIFRGAIGSPDPLYGRQLDGLGGGISSLSKVCVVGPSTIGGLADVDYTFAAIGVRDDTVDYSSNCGNMSAAVGPFAVDSGLFTPAAVGQHGGACVVNVHNTNTGKVIRSTFPLVDGEAAASGDFAVDGVAGTAAPVRLDFLDPAGSRTGKLLPTGNVVDAFDPGRATCIDVGNPCVFVNAQELNGRISTEFSPQEIEKNAALMERLEAVRRMAGVKMGLAERLDHVPESVPKIAMVWTPRRDRHGRPEDGDICVRALSVGQPHKAVPVTVALALAAAANIPGSIVHQCLLAQEDRLGGLKILHPTGVVKVDAEYDAEGNLKSAAVYRTARRLMEGTIFWK